MDERVTLRAVAGEALNVKVYRGYASLCELASISRADVYDPQKNPNGTQRDLNIRHAKEAHAYAAGSSEGGKRFWPEIVLNVRRKAGIKVVPMQKVKGGGEFVKIQIDLNNLGLTDTNPSISRVDGNHRLYFAQGDSKRKLKPLTDVITPFAITDGLDPQDELRIFRDINDKQQKMNTSHLLNIEYRLSTEDKVFAENPALWIAQQLGKREESPFKDKVHTGGKKEKGRYLITLKSVESAMKELLAASQLLGKIKDREKIYKLTEHYWNAVKLTWPTEWSNVRDFKLMTNTPGLTAIGQVGGKLLDIQLRKGRVKPDDLENVVAQMKPLVDWRKSSEDMRGMAGPGAANRVAEALEKGLPEEVDIETIQV